MLIVMSLAFIALILSALAKIDYKRTKFLKTDKMFETPEENDLTLIE